MPVQRFTLVKPGVLQHTMNRLAYLWSVNSSRFARLDSGGRGFDPARLAGAPPPAPPGSGSSPPQATGLQPVVKV